MRAAVIHSFGGIEGLSIEHRDAPVPEPGMALVKVEASSVGFADTLTRLGVYPTGLSSAGFIGGGEMAGEVVAVADGEARGLVGRRVFAFVGLGCHAEFVNVPLESLIPLPDDVSSQTAAAFGVSSIVAQAALERAGVAPDKHVLVRGAAGGIGLAAVRLAVLAGARVLATASSKERADFLRRSGVAEVLDRQGLSINGDRPDCDIIIDPVAGSELPTFVSMLATNGHYVLMGVAGGFPSPDLGAALSSNFFKSISFSTLSLHAVALPKRAAIFERILAEFRAGRLEPDIDSVLPLDAIQDAHRRIETGENRGKIIIEI